MGQCLLNPLARRVHRSDPDSLYHSSPSKVFSSKVSSSPICSRPSFLLPSRVLNQITFRNKNFFSHILHNSRLSLSRNLSSKYSIDPTVFQLSHKYGKAALNSNNDKTRQHSQTLPLTIFWYRSTYSSIIVFSLWSPENGPKLWKRGHCLI